MSNQVTAAEIVAYHNDPRTKLLSEVSFGTPMGFDNPLRTEACDYIESYYGRPTPADYASKPYTKPTVTEHDFEHLIELECKQNPYM